MTALAIVAAHAADIHDAVESRDAARIKRILDADRSQVHAVRPGGITPLHLAASLNNVEMLKLLMIHGASVNAPTTTQRYTPLHWAAHANAAEAARLLLAGKASALATSRSGLTPLRLAVRRNSRDTAWVITSRSLAVYKDPFLDARLKAGADARKSGDLDTARTLYTGLLRRYPGNTQVNFGYGLICLSLGDASRAQLAFQRVVDSAPKNLRARYELAKAHLALRRTDDARREFNALLAMDPPAGVAKRARRYLGAIKRGLRPQRWRHRVQVQVGIFDDSNVNVGPETDIVNIAPIIFGSQTITELLLDDSSQPKSDTGFLANALLVTTYDLGAPGLWSLAGIVNYYQNWLTDSPDNETLFVSGGVAAQRASGRHMLRLPLRVSHINSGHEPLVTMTGLVPTYSYRGGEYGQWTLSGSATLELRDYDSLDERDGTYTALTGSGRWSFGSSREHVVSLMVSAFRDDTDAGFYAHLGQQWNLGLDLEVLPRTVLYGRLRKTLTDYDDREELAPDVREDDQQQYTIGLRRRMTPSWALDLNHQYTDNSSSFDLYSYTRSVTTLSTSYVF
jgi:tetratricopeptide (TPR) repeat protein